MQCTCKILFADDKNIFISNKDPIVLKTIFNEELENISNRFYMNKLLLNTKNTKLMMFTNRNVAIDQIRVNLSGSDIKHTTSLKFLGVTIDRKLTWKTN